MDEFDERQHSNGHDADDPEARLMQIDDVALIERALRRLSGRFRELLVLRELEGLSYQELSEVLGIPIGTVMSGLSRSRQALRAALEYEQRSSAVGSLETPQKHTPTSRPGERGEPTTETPRLRQAGGPAQIIPAASFAAAMRVSRT